MSTSDEPLTPDLTPDRIVQSSGLPDDGIGRVGPSGTEPDPLSALLGTDGGIDFGSLMEQASNMQAQMLAAQQQAAATEIEAHAGGGAVKVVVTGGMEFRSVHIDPSAVDPDDVEMLQDLVLAALRDAVQQVNDLQAGSLGLGGLGIADLFGS
ncbi:MAG: YbaB/EbfC family nucleoid-associated protein [Acidimicrobiales bacterium]|nr:YbaB/EbfC family nucleoid-associated protein [Acidimicrobiales bacterium]